MKRTCASLLLLLLLAASNLACAQALQDPTRPPAALMAPGAGRPAAAPEKLAPRLQSVLIARGGGRHVAVIDGDTVRLGETYKGARVTRIEPNEVELVRGQSRQVLKLDAGALSHGAGIERAPHQ